MYSFVHVAALHRPNQLFHNTACYLLSEWDHVQNPRKKVPTTTKVGQYIMELAVVVVLMGFMYIWMIHFYDVI